MSLQEIIQLENCLLVLNQVNKNLLTSLQNISKLAENQHGNHTRTVNKKQIACPQFNSTNYGLHSLLTRLPNIGTLFRKKSILIFRKITYQKANHYKHLKTTFSLKSES